MAGKRGATSDLNHDNWDSEEAPEQSGSFQRATDDSLKKRIIKTARRRNPISSVRDGGDGEKKSAFTSFTGFGKAPPPTSAAFSFLSNLTTPKPPPKVNGVEGNAEKEKTDVSTFKFNSNPVTSSANQSDKSNERMLGWTRHEEFTEKITTNIFTANTASTNNKDNNPSNPSSEQSNDYYSKLKGLNQSVSNWIKKHVDSNPFINLQPIFKDYESYFAELEKEKVLKPPDANNKTEVSPLGSFVFKPTTNVPDSTTEKSRSDSKTQWEPNADKSAPKFTLGSSITSTGSTTAMPAFSFGNKPGSGTVPFSFDSKTKEAAKVTNTTTPSFSFGVKSSNSSNPAATTPNEATKTVNTSTPSFTFGVQPPKSLPTTRDPSTPFTFGEKVPPPVSVSPASSEVTNTANATVSHVTFGIPSSTTTKEASKTTQSFTFGSKPSNSSSPLGSTNKETTKAASTTTPSFSFGSLPSNPSIPPFSSSSPFTFGNVAKPPSREDQNKDTEEEEEPPKNEFTPVVEKDHIYTIRCKIFVKKDGKFGDRGVGNLYLKPVADSEKVQLIVRADTNLGNLLINLILSESIPTKRLGTKDVMLVCVPTPEMEPPPVPVLLRVKSSEEADQLLETLDKHKK